MLKELTGVQARAVAVREWRQYLDSPVGVIFLMIFLAGIGHLTFEVGRGSFFVRGQADLIPFFDYLPWIFAFFIPAMSMRSWAEERKSGTIEFLLTLPITTSQAVWGKFWASWKFLALSLVLTLPLPLTVMILGSPDISSMITGYVGAWLLAGQMLAISMFTSALSKNQITSFILGSLFCVVFLLLDSPSFVDIFDNGLPSFVVALIENASLMKHFDPWVKGVVRVGGLLQSIIGIGLWLWLTTKAIEINKAK